MRSESSKDQQEERRAMLLLKSQALLNMREPRRTEWCMSPSNSWTMPRRDAEQKRRKTKRRAERAARRKRPHVPAGGKDGWKDLMLMKEESTEEEEKVNFEDPNRPQEREARPCGEAKGTLPDVPKENSKGESNQAGSDQESFGAGTGRVSEERWNLEPNNKMQEQFVEIVDADEQEQT